MESETQTPLLLHGDLDLDILEARDLPNMDLFSDRLLRFCSSIKLSSSSKSPSNPHHHHLHIITSDPFVTVSISEATLARTSVVPNSENPIWNQHFLIPLAHRASHIKFDVSDDDFHGSEFIGSVRVPTSLVAAGGLVERWFPIIGKNERPPKPNSALFLRMRFTRVEKLMEEEKKWGVERAYFPERTRGEVTLYQDAHASDRDLPVVELDGGRVFRQGKCWEDICHAILEAQKLIYIIGWSIYDKVRLVREPTRPLPKTGDVTLGELLKYKSEEGVRVLVLVWDDKTSSDLFSIKEGSRMHRGVMHTHDEDTRKFFKHSSVICVLSPCDASSESSMVKQQIVRILFSHHQKCLLVDTPASGNNRKITAFIGGLDLRDGRYDTPEHRLFTDLDTVFHYDSCNPTFREEANGPRQPWHDLHCKIEGPAVYDVLTNFEQRWRKATNFWDFRRLKKVSSWRDDSLLKLERFSWMLNPSSIVDDPSLPSENDSENWHVQIFRSIDSSSVKGFPKNSHQAEEQNLFPRKNLVVDKSIHTAYVKAIRSAENFIYIENQYFIGSSYCWPSYKSAGANNLIPMELALKITSKIRAREQFAVYIIIPMWPEGSPDSSDVQGILFWQSQTIRLMYKVIGKELKSMNLEEAHPQDYLNFYCLGNRELPNGVYKHWVIQHLRNRPRTASAGPSQRCRRFMVYVHSKAMIVDDEFVLLGSANINERSMNGARDTEIAMGAYQPHHTLAVKQGNPHGQVYGYRMSLWREHLGCFDDRFKDPSSPECVKYMNRIADENWVRYTAEQLTPLNGHLIKYPIQVKADGKIGPLPGYEFFPDVGGRVLGERNSIIPDILTT